MQFIGLCPDKDDFSHVWDVLPAWQNRTLYVIYTLKDEFKSGFTSEKLRNAMPESEMISYAFIRLEQFPTDGQGKVSFELLREIIGLKSNGKTNDEFVISKIYPRNQLELYISRIWSNHLGVPHVNVTDRFFEIGGDSISAFQLINSINSLLQVILSMKELYSNPTIEGLASLCSQIDTIQLDNTGLQKAAKAMEELTSLSLAADDRHAHSNDIEAIFPMSDNQISMSHRLSGADANG
ncbi:Tyrocidine synthase 3 [compost metagenome]